MPDTRARVLCKTWASIYLNAFVGHLAQHGYFHAGAQARTPAAGHVGHARLVGQGNVVRRHLSKPRGRPAAMQAAQLRVAWLTTTPPQGVREKVEAAKPITGTLAAPAQLRRRSAVQLTTHGAALLRSLHHRSCGALFFQDSTRKAPLKDLSPAPLVQVNCHQQWLHDRRARRHVGPKPWAVWSTCSWLHAR